MKNNNKKTIAVIGDGQIEKNSFKYKLAFDTGKAIIDNGYRIQSGGMGGVMLAAFEGAKASSNYRDGDTIAIVPTFDKNDANEYADIIIPTGLDIMRNAIVVNADAVVAIGGGAGTLSEMAIAWSLFKLLIAYDNVDGWSKELAGRKIDDRIRYDNLDDAVYAVESPDEVIDLLKKYINMYSRSHHGIRSRSKL